MASSSLSAFAAPLMALARAVWPHARRLYKEREAGVAPFAENGDLFERVIDQTLSRIRGGNIDGRWWRRLLDSVEQPFITPEFLRKPSLIEWLSIPRVSECLKD